MDDEAVGADGEGENSRKQRICGEIDHEIST